ncbi:MAG: hypothetical protein QOG50_2913 [Actinomycetota bacterium]|nr:hypothetical protein [Actinomycetota bacterium]
MSPRIGARRLNVVIGLAALVMGMLGGAFALFGATAQAANLSCPSGTSEYKVDGNVLQGLSNGESAQFTVSGVTFTFTKVVGPDPFGDDTFDFTSTTAVSAALVKGGEDTNVYNYDPAVTSGSALHPPINGGNEAPTISHVTFCIGTPDTTTTSSTVPDSSTSTSTTTTVPDNTSTSTSTSTTSTTVPDNTSTSTSTTSTSTSTTSTSTTSTTVPESTTTTSTTVPDETTTSTTVPHETTTSTTHPDESTTTPTTVKSATTIVTTTTQGDTPTTLREQGGTVPTTSTTEPVPVTVTSTLPRTGADSALAALFGLSCVVAGGLLMIRKRSWSRP